MPPPVIRACFAAWADRVSMIKPRSPSSRTVPSRISSSRQRFRLGPVSGWLLRSITCGARDGGQREPGAPGEPHRMGGFELPSPKGWRWRERGQGAGWGEGLTVPFLGW